MSNMEQLVIAGLMKRGLSEAGAKGVTANMIIESDGLKPGVNEYRPVVPGSRGGFGLNQWTGPRRRAFEAYAKQQNKPLDDVDLQLDFTMHELNTTEKRAFRALQAATTAEDAAVAYSNLFLRPGVPHLDRRRGEARRLAGLSVEGGAFEGSFPQGTMTDIPTGPDGRPMPSAAQQKQMRYADVDPMASVNGTNMEVVGSTPTRTFRSHVDDKRLAQAQDDAQVGFWDAAGMAIDEGWIATTAARQYGRSGFDVDDNFQFSPELWKEVSAGLPREYQAALGASVSEEHARVIAEQTKRAFEIDQALASKGLTGFGLRLGAAMLDPIAIGVSALSGAAAAPLIYGEKVSRMGRFLRAGTAAAAVNAGIDGYLTWQSPLQEWENIAYSAAAGFALGGAFGAWGRTNMDAPMMREAAAFVKSVDDADALPNNGSLSAARATPLPTPDLTPGQVIADRFANAPMSALGRVRYDMVGVLKQSDNSIIRQIGSFLAEDAVGNADGSVNIRGASENVAREMRTRMGRFYRDYDDAFSNWASAQGKTQRWQHLWNPAVRAQFNREVSFAVRRELDASGDAHVQRVAARMKKEFGDLLEYGKDANIKGFADIKDNINYLTRRFRVEALDELIAKKGDSAVRRMVAGSMMSANAKRAARASQKGKYVEALDYGDALSISKAYIKAIRSRKYGDFNVHRAFNGDDMTLLRNLLDDAGLNEGEITRVTDAIRLKQDSGDKGRLSEAKFRMDLDETFRLTTPSDSRGIGIEDFLDNDAESLFAHYTRSVVGAGEIEKAFANFKVADADGNLPAHAPSWETIKGYAAENHKGSVADWRRAETRMDALYRAVAGIPHEAPSDFREAQRMMRDYNFSRVGGQLGVAQLAELGNIVGQGGMRVFLQNIPALKDIFTSARRGGNFRDPFFSEIEAIWGFGTDLTRASPNVRMDDVHGGTFEGRNFNSTKMQKLDHALQRGKMVTSVASGMSHVNMALQRLTGRVVVQRFMDDAVGRRSINTSRLRSMGISEDLHPRIQEEMRKHVDQTTGLLGRKVQRINIDKWTDVDAKNAFINGVDRWSKKIIQENDVGNMPAFMTTEMGKTIFQFRSFMLASYTKQFLAGVHHKDWETFSAFATSMFFGGLFYVGQTVVNAQGRGDKEDFLEERLSEASIAKAAFLRAGWSSLLPMGVDTVSGAAGFGPIFDFRTSDLSSNVLGNPTFDLLQNIQRGAQGIVAPMVNSDYEFSQQDHRALASTLMFQNAFIVRNGIAALGADLPRFSQ